MEWSSLEPMRAVFAGRRVILAGGHAATWTEHIELLRAIGVTDLLVVATEGRGAGPVPDAPTVTIEPPAELSMMEQIRFGDRMLAEPPDSVVSAVREFRSRRHGAGPRDLPQHSNGVGRATFARLADPVGGPLEDKVVVDDFWDRAGVARQPVRVVPLADAESAAVELDRGDGTVWAAEAREGFHSGASQTYWVRDDADRSNALEKLRSVCDRVRVMPFIKGARSVRDPRDRAARRSRRAPTGRDGRAPAWHGLRIRRMCDLLGSHRGDPDPDTPDIARRAGERLAVEVGFRGTFTVDGVVGVDGFWPTELNPRFGAGIMTIARASGLPILLVNDLVIGGCSLGVSAETIERELVQQADALRGGGTWRGGIVPEFDAEAHLVERSDRGKWTWASSMGATAGLVTAGSGFVRCVYDPRGHSGRTAEPAPRAAEFWSFIDREFATGQDPLTPPIPV